MSFTAVHAPLFFSSLSIAASIAALRKNASTVGAGPLIVIDTDVVGAHRSKPEYRRLASSRQHTLTPELPTIAESGVSGFRYYGWNGVLAPRATSRVLVGKVNEAMRDVLATNDLRQLYLAQGEEPAYSTVEEFAKIIADDFVQMGKMVKLAGLKPE